ncbi:hypothetical protein NPIL_557201 [Nephila pilipes]|uniref:Uncharacterized protein n=1 Tax=Nephila pilipes TaxID=299642 RepID=A0A8X6PDX7_NEPPI|nr:hypothetical protein NPIL_557201 [Nephila pilipes]
MTEENLLNHIIMRLSPQVEIEGSKGLARTECTKGEQWRGKRIRSEGSAESSNNHERQHQSKRRPPVRRNCRKRSAPSSLVENTEVKRRPHGSCKWRKRPIPESLPSGPGTRKMTRREAADENKVRFESEKQAANRRTSPYLTRAGGVETARSRWSRFRPYKRCSGKGAAHEGFLNEEERCLELEQFDNRQTQISVSVKGLQGDSAERS